MEVIHSYRPKDKDIETLAPVVAPEKMKGDIQLIRQESHGDPMLAGLLIEREIAVEQTVRGGGYHAATDQATRLDSVREEISDRKRVLGIED